MSANVYQLRIRGNLTPAWEDEFGGLRLINEPDGTATLTGILLDQPALHGILIRIRDLGLELLSVNQLPTPDVVD
jgi:hypothetical protein